MPDATLRIEYMALDEIKGAPRNPKDHDLGALDRSIERFGYVQPLLLNERTGRLIAGHGRRAALMQRKASGAPAPDRVLVKNGRWFVPVIRGLSFENEQEAEAYLLADNRLTEIGGWNASDLTDILSDLAAANARALDGIGWDADDLDALLAQQSAATGQTRPDFAALESEFEHNRGASPKDGNWFYVEFYGEDERFAALSALLAGHLVGASTHELDRDWFERMARGHADPKRK